MEISRNVKALIITSLFYMLWLGFVSGLHLMTPIPIAVQGSGVIACLAVLFPVFASLYLRGSRRAFLVTLIWAVITIIVVSAASFVPPLITGQAWRLFGTYSLNTVVALFMVVNYIFPLVIITFSYRAYKET